MPIMIFLAKKKGKKIDFLTCKFLNPCDLHSRLSIFLMVHLLLDFPTNKMLSTPPDPCLWVTRTSFVLVRWFLLSVADLEIVLLLESELIDITTPLPDSISDSLFIIHALSSSSSSLMLCPRVTPICKINEEISRFNITSGKFEE